ncbi:hypothetical protein GYMLUDRAFT_57828 [Collybiopsis luxurians FD-317 M1]|uniref:Uncharacterized protein n=1 Tax=Collybiopsis luxurians FD-317 M1 TaxID=944289 RepID=A0A0D0C4N0_9AGAR|nr:hypothetical protein GYMLUDRAFT_57828 [Collybiopsis luxurians FD-317 M1]
MKAVLVASALGLISGAYAQFSINTPASLTTCQPVLIQWQGGTPPYFLSVYNQAAASQTAENLGQQNGTTFTWTVDIAAGQSVGFNIVDSTGTQKQSAAVPIQSGSSTSCVGQSASGSAGSAAPTSTASGSGSSPTTSAGSGSSATNTGSGSSSYVVLSYWAAFVSQVYSSKSAGSSSTGGANPSSTTSSSSGNSASSQTAQFGIAGIVGAAIAALLA